MTDLDPIRAAVYLRISQDATGEGLGVTRQLEDCTKLCEREGWEIAEVYKDNDTSAYKARKHFDRMLADIRAGKVNAIVTWQPDRLYRRFTDLEVLVEIIEKHDVVVHTVKAGDLNLDSAYGRMVARMLSVIAMGEGELKSERWRRSWRQGREAGNVARTGSRMFGYTRDGLVVDDERAIAQRMASDLIAGVPILTLSRQLEAEGIQTTRGGPWRPGTVRQYLTNPRIAGYSTLRGEIVAEGNWEPLIDRDTWETARALLNSRARGRKPRVSLLNGLLFCGRCEHRMITSGSRGQRTYRCPNRPGMPGCGGVSSYAEPIEGVVESYAQTRLADPKVRLALQRLSATGSPQLLGEIAGIESRILELEAQLGEPGIPVATILRAIERSRERLAECQTQLTITAPTPLPTSGGEWPEDLERRRRLIELVVERVELLPVGRAREFNPERVKITRREF